MRLKKLRTTLVKYSLNIITIILALLWFTLQDARFAPLLAIITNVLALVALVRPIYRRSRQGISPSPLTALVVGVFVVLHIIAIGISAIWLVTGDGRVEALTVLLPAITATGGGALILLIRPSDQTRVRDRLLHKVKQAWKLMQLGDDINPRQFIELDKRAVNEQIEPPEGRRRGGKALPANASLAVVLDNSYNLLVLGQPGSGKTTSLQQLARTLLENATHDERAPIPLYFDLTSWSQDKLPVDKWLQQQLKSVYIIVGSDSRMCLDGMVEVVLLLDGLDEMAGDDVTHCINAINEFLVVEDEEVVRPQLVVCCREVEYKAADVKLQFDRAVLLEAWSREQVADYIQRYLQIEEEAAAPEGLSPDARARISAFAQLDAELATVLNTPLMLYSALSSQISVAELSGGSPQDQQSRVLEQYIEYAIQHRLPEEMDQEAVRRQLAWLAQRMGSKTKFYIEDLQPAWLRQTQWKLIYLLMSRLLIGLLIAFAAGFFVDGIIDNLPSGIIAGFAAAAIDLARFTRWIVRPLSILWWLLTLPLRLLWLVLRLPLVGIWRMLPLGRQAREWGQRAALWWRDLWRNAGYFTLYTVLLSLPLALFYGSTQYKAPEDIVNVLGLELANRGINRGIFVSLFCAAIFGIRARRNNWSDDIQTMEDVQWSWNGMLFNIFGWSMLLGLVIGVLAHLYYLQGTELVVSQYLRDLSAAMGIAESPYAWLIIGWLIGAFAGAAFGSMFGAYFIVRPKLDETREADRIDRPDQVLRLSFRGALRRAGQLGLFFAAIFGAIFGLLTRDLNGLYKGIWDGVGIGLMAYISYGGADFIKHNTLRAIFYIKGLPFRYLDRLDELKKSTLIARSGRGYQFHHDLVKKRFQERPAFIEVVRRDRLGRVAGALALIGVVAGGHQIIHSAVYHAVDVPADAVLVMGYTQPHDPAFCFAAGETVAVRAKGNMKAGVYVGWVRPEGTEIGMIGLPILDTYDLIAPYPNAALMCRLVGAETWDLCAHPPDPPLPFIWRTHQMTLVEAGCLEFHINDVQPAHEGGFWVMVEPLLP